MFGPTVCRHTPRGLELILGVGLRQGDFCQQIFCPLKITIESMLRAGSTIDESPVLKQGSQTDLLSGYFQRGQSIWLEWPEKNRSWG